MIHVAYKMKLSGVCDGIGLFADQDIKSGDLIYTPSPLLDVDLTQEQFDGLTPEEQREIKYYGYFDKKSQRWHVAFDAIRILNHAASEVANVTQDADMIMKAKYDIAKGDEILQDYAEFLSQDDEHFNRIRE